MGSAILYGEGPALIAEMFWRASGQLGHEPGRSYRCPPPGAETQRKEMRRDLAPFGAISLLLRNSDRFGLG